LRVSQAKLSQITAANRKETIRRQEIPGTIVRKTALVTGAGPGIGKAIALAFAHKGADVGVADINANAGKKQVEGARIGMSENGGGQIYFEEASMGMHILEKVTI
jgi:shikimate 5-dehydrogenase